MDNKERKLTPIEKLIQYIKSRGLTSGEKAVLDRWIEEDRVEREQHAQAKVLEALERVRNTNRFYDTYNGGYAVPVDVIEKIIKELKPLYNK